MLRVISRNALLRGEFRRFAHVAKLAFSSEIKSKPFDKILVANRGEIACRVFKTAKRMGIKTVAVYSEADASAMHVRMADEAYCIGSAASAESYLKMERILEVAKATGAQAIHPGYGFLSENAKFAEMVEAAGIAFVGPSSGPMNAMGDKINSKKVAKDAKCFVIPGYEGEVRDADHAVSLVKSQNIGYPVMIKASAGGGGKGMRVAYNDNELRDGFRMSKAEAKSSFGDDRMLIERFIEDPHHIEIQVIADTHGNVVAFPERECSVQRRNQKVVEESPSCLLTPETRRKMQEQAIMLCKATKYRNAGTVEMLCDGKQNFYFLEMNTRLQVEHPITELVSGEDLVEHMLWVAAGKALPKRLTDVTHIQPRGWAIESRVYAEDPLRNFLPSIGPLINYKEPELLPYNYNSDKGDADYLTSGSDVVRIDTGVYEGGIISMWYDPMISKLCTHSPTRDRAIAVMEKALDQYYVQGLGNNLTFLRDVMRNQRFRSGNYSTKFIPMEYPKGFHGVALSEPETHQLVATAVAIRSAQNEHMSEAEFHNTTNDEVVIILQDTSNASATPRAFLCQTDSDEALQVHVQELNAKGKPLNGPHAVNVTGLDWVNETPVLGVEFDGTGEENVVQYSKRNASGFHLRYRGATARVGVMTPTEYQLSKHMLPEEKIDVSKYLLCPMPGKVVSCAVTSGQRVEIGQELAVVEAMKMQNVLRSEKAGVIKSVNVKAGDTLKVDAIILEFAE